MHKSKIVVKHNNPSIKTYDRFDICLSEPIKSSLLPKLCLGLKNTHDYSIVGDDIITTINFNYVTNFIWELQKVENNNWQVIYSFQNFYETEPLESRYLRISLVSDDNIFYKRVMNNELYDFENEFIFNNIYHSKPAYSTILGESWKKNWINNTDEITTNPKNFIINLFQYQLRSLKWMYDIENNNNKFKYYGSIKLIELLKEDDKINAKGDKLFNLDFDLIDKKFILNGDKGHDLYSDGGILADEMGLGKTITSLAIVCKNPCKINPNVKLDDISINIQENNLISTKATLVICPSHLTKQWFMEAKKCCPTLKVLQILTKTNHTKITYLDLLEADIVITSYQFLANVSYYINLWSKDYKRTRSMLVHTFNDRIKDIDQNHGIFDIKNKKQLKKILESNVCFEKIKWHRIMVDEAHEIFRSTDYYSSVENTFLFKLINYFSCNYKWYISGTPFFDSNGVENVCNFLNFKINKQTKIGKKKRSINLSYTNIKNNNGIFYNNIERSLFKQLYVRNTKESVKDFIQIPSVIYDKIYLDFSGFEKQLYDSMKSYGEFYLRQLCCNIQISDKFNNGTESVMNFDQVKDQIIKYNTDKINKTKQSLNQLQEDLPGYEARKQMLKNIISSCEFILKSFQDHKNEVDEDTCPICKCEYEDPVITQCAHKFCYECISSVLTMTCNKNECPICRKQLSMGKIYKLENNIEKKEEAIDELTYSYGTKIAKLIKLCKNILSNPKNKIIIFSQWDRLLEMIGKILNNNEIKNVFCKGNVHQRNAAIMAFRKEIKKKSGTTKVIMLSTENAASGTNLTEATHIIFMDPIKGCKKEVENIENQAIGRAVRIGQENQVIVHKLIIRNTIEQDIDEGKVNTVNTTNQPIVI